MRGLLLSLALGLALGLGGALAQGTPADGTSTAGTSGTSTSGAPSHVAPTVENPTENIIFPGQVWRVTGSLPGAAPQSFTVTLGRAPSTQQDGVVAYANYDSDASGNLVLTRLWHDPIDEDPEFLEATRADASGNELHCFLWDPSKQSDLTRFTGVLAPGQKALEAYVNSGDRSSLGSCTITLLR